jgi:hypothetical protein
VAAEVFAQVGGKAVDVAAEIKQRVIGRATRQRPDGGAKIIMIA